MILPAKLGTFALWVLALVSPVQVVAQHYPMRPVRLIVGAPAGSVPDSVARPIAERLAVALGQPVVIENRPGAGGIVAMDALAKSLPDGYTLGLTTMAQVVFNSHLFSKLPYDPLRDIEPVATLVTGAMVVAAHPSLRVSSLAELVAMAKQRPGALFVGTTATGSPPHVMAMRLMRSAGVAVTLVPFSSGPEGLQGVLRGEPPLFVDAPTSIVQHVKAGRLKALVVTGRAREPALPDVPTVSEAGYPGAQGEAWIGLVAPTRTPAPIVQRINREIAAILVAPENSELMARLSFQPLIMTPASFRERLREDHAAWGAVIRDSGIKLD